MKQSQTLNTDHTLSVLPEARYEWRGETVSPHGYRSEIFFSVIFGNTNKQTFLEDKYKVSIFLYAEYNLC